MTIVTGAYKPTHTVTGDSKMGVSYNGLVPMDGLFHGKPIYKWKMNRGTSISGNRYPLVNIQKAIENGHL